MVYVVLEVVPYIKYVPGIGAQDTRNTYRYILLYICLYIDVYI